MAFQSLRFFKTESSRCLGGGSHQGLLPHRRRGSRQPILSLYEDRAPYGVRLLRKALDAVLPRDIAVIDCREVPLSFHARYDCSGKRYLYLIWNAPWMSPFYQGRAYHQRSILDEAALHQAAQDFLGTHDFSAFCSAGGGREDRVRTIQAAAVERRGELLTFSVTGDGFLYNMVRIMAGTLLDMGSGKLDWQAIPGIIASRDRRCAGRTAPPDGLYLDEVFYPSSLLQLGVEEWRTSEGEE